MHLLNENNNFHYFEIWPWPEYICRWQWGQLGSIRPTTSCAPSDVRTKSGASAASPPTTNHPALCCFQPNLWMIRPANATSNTCQRSTDQCPMTWLYCLSPFLQLQFLGLYSQLYLIEMHVCCMFLIILHCKFEKIS